MGRDLLHSARPLIRPPSSLHAGCHPMAARARACLFCMFLLEVTMINAVIAAVGTMLVLSLSRVHVVIAIIVGALVGGLTGCLLYTSPSPRD